MDRNTITGLLLIGAILFGFSYFNQQQRAEQVAEQQEQAAKVQKDSVVTAVKPVTTPTESAPIASLKSDTAFLASIPEVIKADSNLLNQYIDSVENFNRSVAEAAQQQKLEGEYGVFYPAAKGTQEYTTLENDKLIVTFNNKGGRIAHVKLKEYQSYQDYIEDENTIEPLLLFEERTSNQSLTLTNKGTKIETKNLIFQGTVDKGDGSQVLTYIAPTADANKYLQYTYTIKNGSYDVDFQINYVNLQADLNLAETQLNWQLTGLTMEKLASDQRRMSCVMWRYDDEKRDYIREMSSSEYELEANTNWIAFKHKFFTTGLIIDAKNITKGTLAQNQLEGEEYTVDYKANLTLPAQPVVDLKFFFGPNEYDLLKSYDNGMGNIIDHGWGVFGLVNKWLIRPIFNILNGSALNLGLIILLLTLIVKILIMPLTYKNYMSSAKMRVLKPEIEEINERMKDADAMTRQQEVSKLYSQTGVNPMAGCLPMLIQMPIVIAALRFFPSSIDLRHAKFLWAEDLSSYESVLNLGFDIPFYGAHVSLFALLMAVSTFLYTKMNSGNMATPQQPGMPNMNFIMYLMPFMMLFFFNSYSSGLSFYYLCGNVMNIGIMWGIKKFLIDEDKIKAKLADNKKKPKKKSKFQQRMDDLVKQQQEQAAKRK